MSRRAKGIGTWQPIIESMSWLCLLTNCLLFAYSSDQIVAWFPDLFEGMDRHDRVAVGSGLSVAAICFSIEHVLILITFALKAYVFWPVVAFRGNVLSGFIAATEPCF